MSFELAGKIKELARIALEARTKVDALEARMSALELVGDKVTLNYQGAPIVLTRPPEVVAESATTEAQRLATEIAQITAPEKRKPGRPRKVV